MLTKIQTALQPLSCLLVGAVASFTAPALHASELFGENGIPFLPNASFIQSMAYVIVSIVVTGIVTHIVNRAGGKKTKEEASRLILENTKLLLDMKEAEIATYKATIEEIRREIAVLKDEIRHLNEENGRLIIALGRKAFESDKSS